MPSGKLRFDSRTLLKRAAHRQRPRRLDLRAQIVETVPGVKTDTQTPSDKNRYPTLTVTWDEAAFKLTVADVVQQMRDGEPRIEVMSSFNPTLVRRRNLTASDPAAPPPSDHPTRLQVVSMTLQPGEELIVGKRLREVLNQARKRAA